MQVETDASFAAEQPSQVNINIHDRPICDLQFNKDGDLLFSAAKDSTACMIRPSGEIIGVFRSHVGAIASMDINEDTTRLVTGGMDKHLIYWDTYTGKALHKVQARSMVRGVQDLSLSQSIVFSCDDFAKSKPSIGIFDPRKAGIAAEFDLITSPTNLICDFSNRYVVLSNADGFLSKYDLRAPKSAIGNQQAHTAKVNSLKNSFCASFFATASSDGQAKIFSYELEEIKCFVSEDPINSAAIFRTNDKILTAGGIDARDVTLSRAKNFEVNFYDIITTKNIGSYSTHFGTINAVAMHPSCKIYASGGEDGIICVVNMGDDLEEYSHTN